MIQSNKTASAKQMRLLRTMNEERGRPLSDNKLEEAEGNAFLWKQLFHHLKTLPRAK